MSKALEAEATINAPVGLVWSQLTDWTNAPRWMSGVDSMTADGGVEVGTKLTCRARGRDRPSEIVRLEDGTSVTLRSIQGGVVADYTYVLTPIDDHTTRASLIAECKTSGLLWNMAGPVLRFAMRRTDSGQIEELKKVVESHR